MTIPCLFPSAWLNGWQQKIDWSYPCKSRQVDLGVLLWSVILHIFRSSFAFLFFPVLTLVVFIIAFFLPVASKERSKYSKHLKYLDILLHLICFFYGWVLGKRDLREFSFPLLLWKDTGNNNIQSYFIFPTSMGNICSPWWFEVAISSNHSPAAELGT